MVVLDRIRLIDPHAAFADCGYTATVEQKNQQPERGQPNFDECLSALKENVAALLARCDIVTRRDFEVQQRLLTATMAKLEAVEAKVASVAKPKPERAKRKAAAKSRKDSPSA